jgi:hypothetical protein
MQAARRRRRNLIYQVGGLDDQFFVITKGVIADEAAARRGITAVGFELAALFRKQARLQGEVRDADPLGHVALAQFHIAKHKAVVIADFDLHAPLLIRVCSGARHRLRRGPGYHFTVTALPILSRDVCPCPGGDYGAHSFTRDLVYINPVHAGPAPQRAADERSRIDVQ